MQTFKQFLSEDEDNPPKYFTDLVELGQLIKTECSQFLAQSNGLPMFRGTKSVYESLAYITPRKDRRSRNTHPVLHEIFDEVFHEKFGVKARSEGVFATGMKAQARTYGPLYYMFPKNGFKVIWSKEMFDIFNEIEYSYIPRIQDETDRNKFMKIIVDSLKADGVEEADSLMFAFLDGDAREYRRITGTIQGNGTQSYRNAMYNAVKWYIGQSYQEGELSEAIASQNELTIICDGYYLIAYDILNGEVANSYQEFLTEYTH